MHSDLLNRKVARIALNWNDKWGMPPYISLSRFSFSLLSLSPLPRFNCTGHQTTWISESYTRKEHMQAYYSCLLACTSIYRAHPHPSLPLWVCLSLSLSVPHPIFARAHKAREEKLFRPHSRLFEGEIECICRWQQVNLLINERKSEWDR